MPYFPTSIIAAVDAVARIRYVNRAECKLWNENRRGNELRLLTGWLWTARHGLEHRQGLKTASAAYRDAYYALVKRRRVPGSDRPQLVAVRKSA